MSNNATQSHSGEHLVAKRLYAVCTPEICLEKQITLYLMSPSHCTGGHEWNDLVQFSRIKFHSQCVPDSRRHHGAILGRCRYES